MAITYDEAWIPAPLHAAIADRGRRDLAALLVVGASAAAPIAG